MATNLSGCHPGDGIESIARVSGTSVANRLRTGAAATAARRLLAAGNWAEFQNAREISRVPNRSDSDEERHSNAPAQSRGEGLHSAVERPGLYTFGPSTSGCAGRRLLVLECGVLHDVEALEESALLLTISWRREKSDASQSLSPTELHLDEVAVSRMDDEGGAPDAAMNPPPSMVRKAGPGG
jgi:hypothetical protein